MLVALGDFFQVINHGVSGEVLEGVLSEATNFFTLPMEDKMKVLMDVDKCKLGFSEPGMYGGVTLWREGFDISMSDTTMTRTGATNGLNIFLS